MHRQLIVVSLTLGLASFASQGLAQILDFTGSDEAQNSIVHQASCSCASAATSFGRGGQILPSACEGCGLGPCGPGGCPTGDCIGECNFAPYGYCLYRSPCWGACQGACCRTIFGEMLLDVRRWYSKRPRFGALAGNAIGSNVGGCGEVGCCDVGCSDSGFVGECGNNQGILGGSGLLGGLFCGRLFGGPGTGRIDSDCGCEAAGIIADECCSAPLEATCGCEDNECIGGCAGSKDICFQDILSPCRFRGIISRVGDVLFGSKCGCGLCNVSCCEADCGVEEVSCGIESAECAAVTRDTVVHQLAVQGGNRPGPSSTARKTLRNSRSMAQSNTKSRQANRVSQTWQDPATKSENGGVVRRVRFDQPVTPKTEFRFRD